MKFWLRGLAALAMGASALGGSALAQDKTTLAGDKDKVSYMIGLDVSRSLLPVKDEIDVAAFERAVRNAFDGGKPLLSEGETRETGEALMKLVASRRGQAVPGQAPGTQVAAPTKDKVGLLIGGDVGRSLTPIKQEIDLPVMLQALRTALAGGQPLLSEAEAAAVRQTFSQRMQAATQARNAELATKNKSEGDAFLARNKAENKGVFSTPSGLQYQVIRQGSGARPSASDRVRVNYQGTLLDGKVFDSSYERGQPAEFPLSGVIAGWQEGLTLMPVGAKYRFWIPGALGYGTSGTPDGSIGPNALLVFDVELMDILN